MIKIALISILLLTFSIVYPQQKILILKKENKTIYNFYEGSIIAFQLKDKSWEKGKVIKIQKDSIYIKPVIVQYTFMKVDTLYSSILGFSFADIFAFPKSGVRVDYINGRFQMAIAGSNVKWYWIKSGWIFRVGALAYAGLNIINGIIQNDFSFSEDKTKLGIAAVVLLGGIILGNTYKPTLRLGRKYHIEILDFSNQ